MGNAHLVCLRQRVSNLCTVPQSLLRQRPLGQPRLQRLALQQFHDEKIHAILMTDIVERADVRMGEFRNGFGLALQSLLQRNVARKIGRQDFDRDLAVEASVTCTIHFAHAARTERR